MLGISVNGLVLTEHAVEHAGRFLIINLSLFTEVDAANPLMLYLLEGWLDLHEHCQLIEQVPKCLEFAIDVRVL